MRHEIPCLLLLSVALVALSTTPTAAQDLGGLPDWGPCGPPQGMAEPLASAPPGNYPANAECPCFTPGRLAQLPPQPPDICSDSGLVIQISGWFGEASVDGHVGFNVIATEASSRTVGGACLYHRKVQNGKALDQEYSRRTDLPQELASICHEMLASWLAARGGCNPQLPGDREP